MNRTNTSRQTSPPGLLPVEKQFMMGFTGILIPLILTGNTLVIVSYKSNRRLQTRTYTFLVSLAVSDLLVGGVNIPLWMGCMAHYDNCYKALFTFTDLFGAFASILHPNSNNYRAIHSNMSAVLSRQAVWSEHVPHGDSDLRLGLFVHYGFIVLVQAFKDLYSGIQLYRLCGGLCTSP